MGNTRYRPTISHHKVHQVWDTSDRIVWQSCRSSESLPMSLNSTPWSISSGHSNLERLGSKRRWSLRTDGSLPVSLACRRGRGRGRGRRGRRGPDAGRVRRINVTARLYVESCYF